MGVLFHRKDRQHHHSSSMWFLLYLLFMPCCQSVGTTDDKYPPLDYMTEDEIPKDGGNICGECDCYQKGRNVTCVGIIEVSLLPQLPDWTTQLYIWECSIPMLNPVTFEPARDRLEKIQVVGSDLSTIEPNTFKGLTKLSFLDLSTNPLKIAKEGYFQDLANLKYLNLSDTDILDLAILNQSNFHPDVQLVELNLKNALTTKVSNATLLPRIERLILTDLSIPNLNGNTFQLLEYHTKIHIQQDYLFVLDISKCGSKIDNSFFDIYRHLRELHAATAVMQYDSLTKLDAWTNLKVLNLSLAHFHGFEATKRTWCHFPPTVQILDLTELNIEGMKLESDRPNLLELYLGSNRLDTIEILHHLPNIIRLDLSKNFLRSLPVVNGNVPLRILEMLNVANNDISHVYLDYFYRYPNLIFLDVSRNRMKSFDYEIFAKLDKLQTLHLSGNGLLSFEIPNATQLLSLHLDQNHLEQLLLHPLALIKIKHLNLAGNDMLLRKTSRCLAQPGQCQRQGLLLLIKSFRHLEHLDLSKTGLAIWPYELLNKLHQLRILALAGNELRQYTLEQGLNRTKTNSVHLQLLNISGTFIRSISTPMLHKLSSKAFERIDLSETDFKCNCEVANAFERLRFKLTRYFMGVNQHQNHYYCYDDKRAEQYWIREFIYSDRVSRTCFGTDAKRSDRDDASMIIGILLGLCLLSILCAAAYIGLNRRRRRKSCTNYDTYTSVDYVILDSSPDSERLFENNGISL